MADALNTGVSEFAPDPEHFIFEPVAMEAVEQSKKRVRSIKPADKADVKKSTVWATPVVVPPSSMPTMRGLRCTSIWGEEEQTCLSFILNLC